MIEVLQNTRGSKRIANHLREAIITGKLPPGGKILPTKKLSEEYGVALNTAQKALCELAEEGLITRCQGRGTYVADYKNSSLDSGNVILLLPDEKHLWPDLSSKLAREMHRIGLKITLHDTNQLTLPNWEVDFEELDRMFPESPRAVITIDFSLAEYLAKKFPNCRVIVAASVSAPDFSGDIVCYDSYLAAYLGTCHLIETGYTRIGCEYNMKPFGQNRALAGESDLILMGYRAALAEAGLKETHVFSPTNFRKAGQTMEDYFAEKGFPEAFFCNNDFRAICIIKAARKFGKSVPDDLALVGVHNTPWADAYDLTSFDTCMGTIAEECAKLIKLDSDNPGNLKCRKTRTVVQVRPELIIRSSCGCNRKGNR